MCSELFLLLDKQLNIIYSGENLMERCKGAHKRVKAHFESMPQVSLFPQNRVIATEGNQIVTNTVLSLTFEWRLESFCLFLLFYLAWLWCAVHVSGRESDNRSGIRLHWLCAQHWVHEGALCWSSHTLWTHKSEWVPASGWSSKHLCHWRHCRLTRREIGPSRKLFTSFAIAMPPFTCVTLIVYLISLLSLSGRMLSTMLTLL